MSTQLKLRGGTAAQHATFTGASREVTVDDDNHTLRVHDGVTAGGWIAQSPLNQRLLQWAVSGAYQLTNFTRDANGAIVSGVVLWPDGGTGTFTTDVASSAFPGAIDAWHATYLNGAAHQTVTQPQITRDSVTGAVMSPVPAIVIT